MHLARGPVERGGFIIANAAVILLGHKFINFEIFNVKIFYAYNDVI